MNDFKNLKPLGCKPIPQGLPKPKPEDLTPVSGHEYKEPEIEMSAGYKVDIIKEWLKDVIISGNMPKTQVGIIGLAVLIFLVYWLLS